jgi:hypothetical protein
MLPEISLIAIALTKVYRGVSGAGAQNAARLPMSIPLARRSYLCADQDAQVSSQGRASTLARRRSIGDDCDYG